MNESKFWPNGEYQGQGSREARNDNRRRPNSSLTRNSDSYERMPRQSHTNQWRNQHPTSIHGEDQTFSGQDWPAIRRGWSKQPSPDVGSTLSSTKERSNNKQRVTEGTNQSHSMAKYIVKKRDDAPGQPRSTREETPPGLSQQPPPGLSSAVDSGPGLVSGTESEWPSLGGSQPQLPTVAARASRPIATRAVASAAASGPAAASGASASPARPLQLRAPPLPPSPLRLVTPGGLFAADAALEYLEPGNTNFAVVGVLGLQAAGKSSVLNALLGDQLPGVDLPQLQREFEVETLDHLLENSHCTRGVQLQVTPERCLLLDCEALLALPSAESLIQAAASERRGGGQSDQFITVETGATMHGLQLGAFLMSACHILLVVQDGWPDPDVLRLLLTADTLRPTVLEDTGFQPRLLFVLNRTPAGAASAESQLPQLRDLLAGAFEAATFRLDPADVFCLPLLDGTEEAAIEFKEEVERLRKLVLTAPRHHMLPVHQSLFNEKVWLDFATRVWEEIQKSVMLAEYHRLIG